MTEESRYSSRKFWLAITTILISTLGLFTGYVSGEEFSDIIPMILMFYGASNVASEFAKKGK